jgi:small-conductance mechanosensitive channel
MDPSLETLLADLSLRVVRFLVALAGVLACVLIWDIPVLAMTAAQTPSGQLMSQILSAVALLLIADLVWSGAKGWIDAQLSRIASVGHGDPETGANARLLTLLPLGRKALGTALIGVVALSLLSIFGIAVTPLLAGAGVVGIAIGFGAQTLVRDILSGFFYLLEDVFRIGDYIEGGSAKGTVERITLRSTRLRAQNGNVWHVNNGEVIRVANKSQSWSRALVDVVVAVDANVDEACRVLAEVGTALHSDPEWATKVRSEPDVLGVHLIDPTGVTLRVLCETEPADQFEVEREYRLRVLRAFEAARIPLAQAIMQRPDSAPA